MTPAEEIEAVRLLCPSESDSTRLGRLAFAVRFYLMFGGEREREELARLSNAALPYLDPIK